ncbi:hypothetical protein [Cellulomonas taurus]|uniref:hypothetical protein n=1 Tax=Cellulomonas taurus TaxID=2729175 RepID=UPI00197F2B94|nr:hypothetical protein [Cellulomonas taurus]
MGDWHVRSDIVAGPSRAVGAQDQAGTSLLVPHHSRVPAPDVPDRRAGRDALGGAGARVAAAEQASSGNFSNWFATLMAGVVCGGAWSSVIATVDRSGGWLKFVGAMIACGIVIGLLTILLLAAPGRTLIRL